MALKMSELTDEFVRKLAREYLSRSQTMAGLAKEYNSSPGTIANILYNGIVDSKIDTIVAEAIIAKVVHNTRPFEKNKTRKHWEKAKTLRLVKEAKQQIAFLKKRLEELSFQLETYDAYYYDDEAAPSKESIQQEIANVELDIYSFELFVRGAGNE